MNNMFFVNSASKDAPSKVIFWDMEIYSTPSFNSKKLIEPIPISISGQQCAIIEIEKIEKDNGIKTERDLLEAFGKYIS